MFFYHARSCSNVVKGRRDLDKNTFSYIIEKILRDKGLRVDRLFLLLPRLEQWPAIQGVRR